MDKSKRFCPQRREPWDDVPEEMNTVSATEYTGLIPVEPEDEEEKEDYRELY